MKHYVLVHGAWEGSWTWNETKPVLEQQGHTVTTVDLPGTLDNPAALSQVTLDSYVQAVAAAIARIDEKVVLVGHSMAGAVISQVAEFIPEHIDRLVYVTAFLLKQGGSVLEAMQGDPDGEFLPELTFSADQSSATVSEQTWRDKAFHDVAEDGLRLVLPRVDVAQSTEPFMAKIDVSDERFGSVPKTYIRTSLDKVVSPTLQDEMIGNWPVEKVQTLTAGHFPTLSVPNELASALL